jgi:hypothetical protein
MITSAKELKYTLPDATEVVANIEIVKNGEKWTVPINEANTDYQEYLEWVAEGNTPEPADAE